MPQINREQAQAAALSGIHDNDGAVDYETVAPHFCELFRAVVTTDRPALVLMDGKLLTCLVPAEHLLELNAYVAEQGGELLDFKGRVANVQEVLGVDSEPDPETMFIFFAIETLKGNLAFFTFDDPGVPQVAMVGGDVIENLADFSSIRADLARARRFS